MAAADVATIGDYMDYIKAHPEEEQRLVADFLIKVTRFFRDAPLFDRLRLAILPELIAAAADERELRLWSAGCATGEEAYSLAILVATLLERHASPPPVRIFATDLDEGALAFGRRGTYPASTLADTPPDLVERWFTQRDGVFEVSKQIRAMIVFGGHDLGQRPPFPHTDLILCRNVLIYFTPELQRRALEIFAYSLRDGGYLVLGKSETPRPVERSFEVVDRRLRIYRRHGPRELLLPARLQSTSDVMGSRGVIPHRPSSTPSDAVQFAADFDRDAGGLGRRSEELVRKLPIGIAVMTSSYDIEMINGAAREMLGIHGTAIGQDLVHLAKRVDSNPLRELFDRVSRAASPPSAKTTVIATSTTGKAQSLELTCLPDRPDERGVPEALLLVIEDVTEHAEQFAQRDAVIGDLRTEAEESRLTAARATKANEDLLKANRELTDSVDRLREQGEDLRVATTASQVAAEEIETLNEELQSSNEELETLHEEAQATVEELNVANEELQARTVDLETLANKHAQEQARLSTILASMADAVLVVDRDGRPVRSNDAFEEIMGGLVNPFSPANEHGVPLSAVEAPTHRVAQGESFRVEFTALSRDGTRRWFEATGRPLHGEDGGGVLVIRDITDRSMRMLQEEFLSWAGHELRTPLTALQSYLQMAVRRLGHDVDDRVHAYLASATEQAKRQATLVEELVDGTRLRSGRYSFAMAPVDLVQVVEHAVEIAQAIAPNHAIEFKVGAPALFVNGNAARLEQAFLNLLNNAIKHAIGTERIEVSVAQRAAAADVHVRDYGPGIPLDVQETIFERFYRASQASGSNQGGLGLGLFIVREIVRAHGGEVTVDSTPGDGAEFTVHLPLLNPQPAVLEPSPPS
jgi:two-component system CheB/CheR fusion protein